MPIRLGPPGAEEEFVFSTLSCVYWPRLRAVMVADLHLGHGAVFQTIGVPIPGLQLAGELARLDACVTRFAPESIFVLGDLLHSGAGLTGEVVERVGAWRAAFQGSVRVIEGNHDRAIARVKDAWGLELLGPRHELGGFVLKHFAEPEADRFLWCGHEHPATHLGGRADGVRVPCFAVACNMVVIPAFSRLAAGSSRGIPDGAELYALTPERVLKVPGRAAASAGRVR
ncbi:MAG: ligase-associated DNA damage response endonuclease PdeM [Phycisphaerales bacterium]